MDKCMNCGKFHTFRNCKLPITSNGIIHVHEGKYLMICRKKSLGYVDFISGKYTMGSTQHIMNLIDEMTVQEKNQILEWDFLRLSHDLWGGGAIEHHAMDKFTQLKTGVRVQEACITLRDLVRCSSTAWDTPEWGFPKGRRNVNESDLACALREYEEETGYSRKHVHIISNLLPYEEVFIGSNYKAYKHKYYVAFNAQPAPTKYVHCNEVSDMKLFTYEEAVAAIRPYNLERLNILSKVHAMLQTFFSPMLHHKLDELADGRRVLQVP